MPSEVLSVFPQRPFLWASLIYLLLYLQFY